MSHRILLERLLISTYHNHVELPSLEFIGITFEVLHDGMHFGGLDALIRDAFVVQINHRLADIYSENRFAVCSQVHGQQA